MEQRPSPSCAQPFVEQRISPDGLKVTITAYPAEGPDAEQIRQRQLSVTVRLLKRATVEASQETYAQDEVRR
ncbi:MAG TPA: hypothetical protein VNX67_09985 [Solirubrobacteraceae bacterium]|jgi:hypothetical protein|nr:hypothetical protein [Solirubrobacteraceae bacterium]